MRNYFPTHVRVVVYLRIANFVISLFFIYYRGFLQKIYLPIHVPLLQ